MASEWFMATPQRVPPILSAAPGATHHLIPTAPPPQRVLSERPITFHLQSHPVERPQSSTLETVNPTGAQA